MKKRQRKVRLIRAAIQLVFFIFYPALFSTAFAGVKSVFQAIAAHQQITWNSFLDVTGLTSAGYDFVWQTFLWICMCIRFTGRCHV